MLAFGAFVVIVGLLVATAGRPYRQSWHDRFGEIQP